MLLSKLNDNKHQLFTSVKNDSNTFMSIGICMTTVGDYEQIPISDKLTTSDIEVIAQVVHTMTMKLINDKFREDK